MLKHIINHLGLNNYKITYFNSLQIKIITQYVDNLSSTN